MKAITKLIVIWACSLNAYALSLAPEPKPEIGMLEAIQKAKEHVSRTEDLSHHYLDRVWVGRVENENERKWIISWSPDGEKVMKSSKGWIIVTVDMRGNVSTPEHGVSWIDKRTVEALQKIPPIPAPPEGTDKTARRMNNGAEQE